MAIGTIDGVIASGARGRVRSGVVFQTLPAPPAGGAAAVKRWVDVAGATVLLAAATPLLAVIAMVVRLESGGPVILRQERVGRDLRLFHMYKFRSMVAGAEHLRDSVAHLNQANGPLFKIRNDPRTTAVGRTLRRFSLDELPQLFNVLRGDMSLVGPRPPFPTEVDEDRLRQRQRLQFPPGMTGLWQVSGRSELPYESMLELDFSYMRRWSPLLDLVILFRTLPAVLLGRGAC